MDENKQQIKDIEKPKEGLSQRFQKVVIGNIELSFYQVKKFYRVSCTAEKIEDAKGAKAKPSTQKPSRKRSENSKKTQVMEAGAQVQNTITKLKILKSC